MTITATQIDAALKELYDGQSVTELVYDESQRPFMSWLNKSTDFAGRKKPYPVIYEDVAGRAATFADAQNDIGPSKIEAFEIDIVKDYGVARIDTEAILRSRNDKGAFVNGLKHMVDSALNRLANRIESDLFRSATGAIGQVGTAGISSGVFTLTAVADIVNFYVGQKIVFASSLTAALRDSGASGTVTAVDRSAGTVTIATTPTAAAAGDYIYTKGDRAAGASPTSLKPSGLADWLPSSAPSSTAFFGVDRSVDPTRLGGLRVSGSSSDIEGSILDGAYLLGRESAATPNAAWVSFATLRQLVVEMSAKTERPQGGEAKAGFTGVSVIGPKGVIEVHAAPFCQDNVVWLLTSKSWELTSMGELPQVLEADGLRIQRVSNADAYEVRIGAFYQLACKGPGLNARITLS